MVSEQLDFLELRIFEDTLFYHALNISYISSKVRIAGTQSTIKMMTALKRIEQHFTDKRQNVGNEKYPLL